MSEKIILYHATNKKNKLSILNNGLTLNNKSSGYGQKPKHKAIYLFWRTNANVIDEMVKLYGENVSVFRVEIRDTSKLIPDEDSKVKNWEDSIEKFGTCAYTDNIPVNNISYCGDFNYDTYVEYINRFKRR